MRLFGATVARCAPAGPLDCFRDQKEPRAWVGLLGKCASVAVNEHAYGICFSSMYLSKKRNGQP